MTLTHTWRKKNFFRIIGEPYYSTQERDRASDTIFQRVNAKKNSRNTSRLFLSIILHPYNLIERTTWRDQRAVTIRICTRKHDEMANRQILV